MMLRSLECSMLGMTSDIPVLAPLCAQAGIGAIGVPVALFEEGGNAEEMTAIITDNGLRWGLLPMPADFYYWGLSDEEFEKALKELDRRSTLAEKLGIRYAYNHVWPCSTRPFDENLEWHICRVRRVAQVLRRHGVRYGLEFIGPREVRRLAPETFIHSLAGIAALADAAGEDTGVVFDSYHWYCSNGGDMDDLLWMTTHADRLVAFHVNDAVAGRSLEEQKDMERLLPMETGIIDTRDIFRRFREKDPDALYMIEPFHPACEQFAAMTPEEAVQKAAQCFARIDRK